jgi:hypothetical protein
MTSEMVDEKRSILQTQSSPSVGIHETQPELSGVNDKKEASADILSVNLPSIELIWHKNKFVPARRTRLHNDLLLIVGYLEFFNALDFPANIWQSVPVPTFAVGLMATGGSIALLASSSAFFDFRRAWKNVILLREERAYLLERYSKLGKHAPESRQVQAWLSVNFRELGWELIDRLLMDVLVGFASILVGVGTIMAIGGANRKVFDASNLLSGYIGNGFVALYGLVNAAWSAYLYLRARKHKKVIRHCLTDKNIQARAVWTFRNHQIYAMVNGGTLLVSSAGSLISSTMWWGYVILIPCIFSSVFCNIFWRKHVGYDRLMSQFMTDEMLMLDIYQQISQALRLQQWYKQNILLSELKKTLGSSELLHLTRDNDCYEALCARIAAQNQSVSTTSIRNAVTIDHKMIADSEEKVLRNHIEEVLTKQGMQSAIYRERVLYELLGAYGTLGEPRSDSLSSKVET